MIHNTVDMSNILSYLLIKYNTKRQWIKLQLNLILYNDKLNPFDHAIYNDKYKVTF